MLAELIPEYMEEHPTSEHPMNWFFAAGEEKIIEMLKNRKGRMIELTEQPIDQEDGGVLVYVENGL
jgi:hypothetical protein